MISFIIPAYNESGLIGPTVHAAHSAAQAIGIDYEIIVVNDDSHDATATEAQQAGAHVITVHCRQIAAVRNAGARQAKGDILIFIDADTLISQDVLRGTMEALDDGAIAGGAWISFDQLFLPARLGAWLWNRILAPWNKWAAGCYLFTRKDLFQAVGGFDEQYYAAEEIILSRRLREKGPFAIVRHPVLTSARKLRMYSIRHQLSVAFRSIITCGKSLKSREGLGMWYEGKREK